MPNTREYNVIRCSKPNISNAEHGKVNGDEGLFSRSKRTAPGIAERGGSGFMKRKASARDSGIQLYCFEPQTEQKGISNS